MWYRVFSLTELEVQPAALLEHLRQSGLEVEAHVRGDDSGWFEAELVRDNLPLTVSRFVVQEEGIRAELNSWAAWIEEQEQNPHRDVLMRRFIAVKQIFTAEVPDAGPDAAPL